MWISRQYIQNNDRVIDIAKAETLGQNRNIHEWEVLNFWQVRTIKALIKYRSAVDKFYHIKKFETNNIEQSNGEATFYELITDTITDSDTAKLAAEFICQLQKLC